MSTPNMEFKPNMEFLEVPEDVQEKYHVGHTIEVCAAPSPTGGTYSFVNSDDEIITVQAEETCNWGIKFRGLPH